MADVNISKFRAQVVREGSKPATPGFVVSEGQNPVDPAGSGQNHLPVTIGTPANGLAVTEAQVLTIDKAQIFAGTSSQFVKGDGTLDSTAYGTGSVTSVALTMPAAFSVANSPVTTAGTLAVTGAGTTAQYIRGDGTLATFPALSGFVPYTGATADVNLGTFDLLAESGTFENNGSSNTLTVNHTSGSGYGIIVTKGGNNEALYVSKTSGSGNAMTVVGGRTSLVDLALSSVTNTAGDFLTLSGGVVHKRTAAEVRTDIGAGTVTSVGLSSATSGVTIGSTPITTSGTITLAIATASGSQNGLLSSTDWSTFNGKQNALTLTTTGTSGAATLVGSTLNIPQYQAAGTYVTEVTASSPLASSGGTTPNITIQQASGSQNGFLSSTDWTTFNNKQNALTNPVTGTGTTNYLAKFTGSTTVGNSQVFDDGTNVGIGTNSPVSKLTVEGQVRVTNLTLQGFYQPRTSDTAGAGVFGGNSFVLRNGATSEDLCFDVFNRSTSVWYTPVTIKNTGNLLVGTTSDAGFKLDVNGSGVFRNTLALQSSGVNSVQLSWTGSNTGLVNLLHSGSLTTQILASGNSYFNGGNVGIGTSSPTYKFVVSNSGGTGLEFDPGTLISNRNLLISYNRSSSIYSQIQIDASLTILGNQGNVLIGTTTDVGAKLYVNGGIRTANPTGSTSNDWLLGRALVSGTSSPDRWIRVQIGNLYYDILAVYMGSV